MRDARKISLLACLLVALLFAGALCSAAATGKGKAPCTINLVQDTATVGQPVFARVVLPAGTQKEAITCAWAYRIGPAWQEIPAHLEGDQVQMTPWDQGWLKLVINLINPDGSASTCTSNTMPVLHPVSPILCRMDSQPIQLEGGPGLSVSWAVQADVPPLHVATRWYGAGSQVAEEVAPDGLSGSASFLPNKDGPVRLVVEATDANGRKSTFDSGLSLVHTYKNGTRRVVTDAMLADKVKEVVDGCRAEAQDPYSQARWLHDYLARSALYDFGYTLYDPHGVLLLGTGVCQSFALAYQKLLTEMGIPNRYVTGIGRGGRDMDFHAWNLVQIDGNWYHVDVTWDERGGHLYFLKSDNYMKKTHSWAYDLYPEAPRSWGEAP